MSKMAIFYLTCPNEEEADKISKVLLDKRLVACAKRFPVKSKSWWKGKMGSADEVLVSYETVEENFE
ncbi:MAG: CutA1 divalent ion tolerance protein, periplasmic divalent cation tolerance protein, partial [Microgenomates group bacterium GW2011_GWC1_38_14]